MPQFFSTILDIFLHLDKNLAIVIDTYGTLTYGLLFLIIFLETGFVVTPFLPGDSLLFAAGALSATSSLNIVWLNVLLIAAAILGDTVNYWIGHFIGPKIYQMDSKWIKREHLNRTHTFYEKYGGHAIILARFVPIVRTFAPFVAGIAKMNYTHFISYNVIGGIVWVSFFTLVGYFFGNLPFVKANFEIAIIAIIIISISPILIEWYKVKLNNKRAKEVPTGH